jgi:hypothetical protein
MVSRWLSYLDGSTRTVSEGSVSNPGRRHDDPGARRTPMYIPAAFAETDKNRLHDFIEQHSFGSRASSS